MKYTGFQATYTVRVQQEDKYLNSMFYENGCWTRLNRKTRASLITSMIKNATMPKIKPSALLTANHWLCNSHGQGVKAAAILFVKCLSCKQTRTRQTLYEKEVS
jgi:hypothetical protein